jgi:hypothetical protein
MDPNLPGADPRAGGARTGKDVTMRRLVPLLVGLALVGLLLPSPAASGPAPPCDGHAVTIIWSEMAQATNGNDVILGSAGPDVINGRGGSDRICGGTGNDTIGGGGGRDRIFGEGGNDELYAGIGGGLINGGYGVDDLHGGTGSDGLLGAQGRDTLTGGKGADFHDGGLAYDTCHLGIEPGDTADNCELISLP